MEYSCRTATGKEYAITHIGSIAIGSTGILYIEVIGSTIAELAPVFADHNETASITELFDNVAQKTYTGYTNLFEIVLQPESNSIKIGLNTQDN